MTPKSGRIIKNDGSTVNIADILGGEPVTGETADVNKYMPCSGRMLKEDGSTVNIADILGGEPTGETADIEKYMPMTGRFIRENGEVVNIAGNITAGGGGGTTPQPPAPTPGGTATKDVNFFDYDGTLISAYTAEEAAKLSELPTPPQHAGLAFQGWNYTLDEIKKNADAADIGALYMTDDEKTRLYISLNDDLRKSIVLRFNQSKASGVEIDWGDGNKERVETLSVKIRHDYATTGDYVIKLAVDADCVIILGYTYGLFDYPENPDAGTYWTDTPNEDILTKIEIGARVEKLNDDCCENYINLKTVTVPNGLKYINANAFNKCEALKFLVIPKSIIQIGDTSLNNCRSLTGISLPITLGAYAWDIKMRQCNSLKRIVLPPAITDLRGSFGYCYELKEVIAKSTVTATGNAFEYCRKLKIMKNLIPGNNGLNNSYIEEIEINAAMAIGSCSYAKCLRSVVVGPKVTQIPSNAFSYSKKLSSIKFMGAITAIGSATFSYCYGLKRIDFTQCTAVPTIASAIVDVPKDIEILVPAALADAWKKETNWLTLANNIKGV